MVSALAQIRKAHAAIAPVVLTPLAITVASGMGYRLLKDWGGLSREQVHWLMVLHEGEWLGKAAEPVNPGSQEPNPDTDPILSLIHI